MRPQACQQYRAELIEFATKIVGATAETAVESAISTTLGYPGQVLTVRSFLYRAVVQAISDHREAAPCLR